VEGELYRSNRVRRSEAGVGRRERRVPAERALEPRDALGVERGIRTEPDGPCTHVVGVRGHARTRAAPPAPEMQPQLVDDRKRDFVLDVEDVTDRPIEVPRPDGHTVAHANELHVYPERVPHTQDGAVDDVINTEPWPDLSRVARALRAAHTRRL